MICSRRLFSVTSAEEGDGNLTKHCWRYRRFSREQNKVACSRNVIGCPSLGPPALLAFSSFRNQHSHSLLGKLALPTSPNLAQKIQEPPCNHLLRHGIQFIKLLGGFWEDGPSLAPSPLTLHLPVVVVGSPGADQGLEGLEKGQERKVISRVTSVMDPWRLKHALSPREPRFGSAPGLLRSSLPPLSF